LRSLCRAYDRIVAVVSRLVLVLAVLLAACGAPAASSPVAPVSTTPTPAPLGSPSAAETREITILVSGLI